MNKDSQILLIIEAARQEGFWIDEEHAEYIWCKFSQSRESEWINLDLWRAEEIFAVIRGYIE